jgi:alpha-ketoglutarate-dependent taurine dioxygenase
MLPTSGIHNLQPLAPRTTDQAPKNRYSGHYGLNAFPLYTDLAHWAVPPRYLLLRCLVGSRNVVTKLLPAVHIVSGPVKAFLQKAVLRVRHHRRGSSGLLRALSGVREQVLFRWDSVFLEPVNDHAVKLKQMMEGSLFNRMMSSVCRARGDTLLLDNCRLLHGRSAVRPDRVRRIERIYLFEVNSNGCES